jgi:hypothetical protein
MTVRVQFDITDERLRELEELMERCGIETRKDLFNNALSLMEWVVEQRANGRAIAAINESSGSYKELQMPFFRRLERGKKMTTSA